MTNHSLKFAHFSWRESSLLCANSYQRHIFKATFTSHVLTTLENHHQHHSKFNIHTSYIILISNILYPALHFGQSVDPPSQKKSSRVIDNRQTRSAHAFQESTLPTVYSIEQIQYRGTWHCPLDRTNQSHMETFGGEQPTPAPCSPTIPAAN
jgi:hypothetical protein